MRGKTVGQGRVGGYKDAWGAAFVGLYRGGIACQERRLDLTRDGRTLSGFAARPRTRNRPAISETQRTKGRANRPPGVQAFGRSGLYGERAAPHGG